jgi:hypothetical protein
MRSTSSMSSGSGSGAGPAQAAGLDARQLQRAVDQRVHVLAAVLHGRQRLAQPGVHAGFFSRICV